MAGKTMTSDNAEKFAAPLRKRKNSLFNNGIFSSNSNSAKGE